MNYLVVDVGSSSVKICLAELTEGRVFQMKDIYRLPMTRSFINGHLSTNVFLIYDCICWVLGNLVKENVRIDSLGIDSWCSDFCLMDLDTGSVLPPVFYRDKRTDGYMNKVEEKMGYREIYNLTTQRKMPDSTLTQLMAYQDEYADGLKGNKKILFIGDFLMYLFTGKICSEASVASYSQMYNLKKSAFEDRIFETFRIPGTIQPPVIPAGTVIGPIRKDLQDFLGTDETVVTAPAVHDTSSAAVAVPAGKDEKWAFLATGSWFLMGMELEETADVQKSYEHQMSNTALAFGHVLLKKNIMGMWLLQECKRQWEKEGIKLEYGDIAAKAEAAEPFYALIDTEYPDFYHPDDMVKEIRKYLKITGQRVPEKDDVGQITRIIYESIVLRSAEAFDMLKDVTGKEIEVLYVIGGANRVAMLNQFLADILGITVRTGPSEASSMGNALIQAYGMGELGTEEEIREVVRSCTVCTEFSPGRKDAWDRQKEKYKGLCGGR